MPRLKAAIQARKETALEALRDGLWAAGINLRPRLGCPGYDAVRLAINKNTWDGLVEGKRGEGVGGGEKRKNTSKINLNTHQSKT